jgi:hypothetical protein
LNLKETFSVEIEALPPYSFELTIRWYWFTPQETCEKGICWTANAFVYVLNDLPKLSKRIGVLKIDFPLIVAVLSHPHTLKAVAIIVFLMLLIE